jgi:hypothetical protein
VSRARLLLGLGTAALLLAACPSSALAAVTPAPALSVTSLATPTNFTPGGEEGVPYTYDIRVANLGGAATDGSPITITDTLPKGLTVKGGIEGVTMFLRSENFEVESDYGEEACEIETEEEVSTVSCEISESLPESIEAATIQPLEERRLVIEVNPPAPAAEGQELLNHVVVEGGGSPPASTSSHGEASKEPAPAGVSLHTAILEADGSSAELAASHPYQLAIGFAANTKAHPPEGSTEEKFVPAGGDLKDIEVTLPQGFSSGAALAQDRCSPADFNATHNVAQGISNFLANACPDASAVGLILVQQISGVALEAPLPLYNLTPPPGVVAELGAQFNNLPFYIDIEARPDNGYKAVATLRNLTQLKRLTAATTVIWGTPASPLHDATRGSCVSGLEELYGLTLPGCEPPEGLQEKPFLRLPSSCISPLDIDFAFDTWSEPGQLVSQSSPGPVPAGCNAVPFAPSFEAAPTSNLADSPTGLNAHLHIPQPEEPEEPGEADLRKTVVTLPRGLVANPSQANGLEACSEAEIGYEGKEEGTDVFSNQPASCPAASRLGTVKIATPLLDHTLESKEGADGSVYLATPHQNPTGSLLALYIVVHDPVSGVVVKLPGKVEPDPVSGQLTASFEESPQLPFEDFELGFFGGPEAPLRTPAACGEYETKATLTPWSAPESGPPAQTANPFQIAQPAPGQSSCPQSEAQEPNAPLLRAGTQSAVAGSYSPFSLRVSREDGSQEIKGIDLTLPPGLSAKLAGVPYCPEEALAAARSREHDGGGAEELASPSCPVASRIGTVEVAAGAGPAPFHVRGPAYLAGPYEGAPLSVAFVIPALAGPFDLGAVLARTALHVDPETAQVHAVDRHPYILDGIPLDLRTVSLKLDRPGFTLNPTSCDEMSFSGEALSVFGQSAPLSQRFQVGECSRLGFKPKLSLRLKGKTARAAHPALKATLTMPAGDANIARAAVALPHSEFLDQGHIRTVCTRVQFNEGAGNGAGCPAGSVYGHATAWSPLLEAPLSGPVYLRSSSHKLPDLVASLDGQIHIDLDGRIDSIHGGIRSTFEVVPDAPVSKFVLTMQGGSKGLLVNSTDLCKGQHLASARFSAQNARYIDLRPPLVAKCPNKRHGHHKHGRHAHRRAAG